MVHNRDNTTEIEMSISMSNIENGGERKTKISNIKIATCPVHCYYDAQVAAHQEPRAKRAASRGQIGAEESAASGIAHRATRRRRGIAAVPRAPSGPTFLFSTELTASWTC